MSEAPAVDTRRRDERQLVGLGLVAAACLGLFPYARALPWLGAHMRRASAELLGAPVPFSGWPLAMAAVLAVLVSIAGLTAGAARRRVNPAAPLIVLTFSLSLLAGYVHRIDFRDQEGERRTATPVWTRDLGPLRVPFDDMTLVCGKGGHFFGAVRTAPDGFEVFDCADGHTAWKGTSNSRHPLSGANGVLVVAEGQTVAARAIEDGRTRASWAGTGPIETIVRHESGFVVKLADGALAGLDADLKQRWSTPAPAAPITAIAAPPASLLVVEGHAARLLDARTGAVRWTRPLQTGGVLRGRASRCGLLMLEGADGIHGIDAATGGDRMTFAHVATLAQETARVTVLDTDALLVQDGGTLARVSPDGRIEWTFDARGETLTLHERGPGACFLETSGGKVLGLDIATGRIAWEWWRGGLAAHALPPQAAPLAYAQPHPYPMVQETPGAPLCLLDTASGRLGPRLEMPAGLRVRRVLEDGRQLVILGRDADDHSTVLALPRPAEMNPPT